MPKWQKNYSRYNFWYINVNLLKHITNSEFKLAKQTFQTEVSQLLQLIIHSLYSQKEIFLRELISNSSDALDKLKYLTLTQDEFKSMDFEPRIDIEFEEGENPTLTIKDSGIGMSSFQYHYL